MYSIQEFWTWQKFIAFPKQSCINHIISKFNSQNLISFLELDKNMFHVLYMLLL